MIKDTATRLADRFRTFVSNFALTVVEERVFLSIYFRKSKHLPKRTQDSFRTIVGGFMWRCRVCLAEGRDSGHFIIPDLSVTEQTVTGMVTWIFNWYQADGKRSAEDVAAILEQLVLSAVGAKEAAASAPPGKDSR